MKVFRKSAFTIMIGLIIVISCFGRSVYAYFVDSSEELENIFSIASISSELVEPVLELRGSVLHKEPFVVNTGTVPCLVRVRVTADPEEIFVSSIVSKPSSRESTELLEEGYKFWLDFQNTWKYWDGYWYYSGVLEPDEDTSPIFKTVNWLDIDGDGEWVDYQNFNIYVYKEVIPHEYVCSDGKVISALDSEGNYSLEKALELWNYR